MNSVFGELGGVVAVTLSTFVVKLLADALASRKARHRVLEAEKDAFRTGPEAYVRKTQELAASQEQLEQRTKEIQGILDHARASVEVGLLLDLANKQVEKYQTETQARAGWSFIFAIIAMFAGLGFVIWGGTVVVSGGGWQKVAAGSVISAIGGTVSAFITTTFLNVHKLSLLQLNRYFRQPVINANILTAQRIADVMDAPEAKHSAYMKILDRVVALIREDDYPSEDVVAANDAPPKRKRTRAKASRLPQANPTDGSGSAEGA